VLEQVAQGSHGSGIVSFGGANRIARLGVGHGNPGTRIVDSCEGDVLDVSFILVVTEVVWLRTGEHQQRSCSIKLYAYQGFGRAGPGWRLHRLEQTWLLCLEVEGWMCCEV
jgi:hypothetical protein